MIGIQRVSLVASIAVLATAASLRAQVPATAPASGQAPAPVATPATTPAHSPASSQADTDAKTPSTTPVVVDSSARLFVSRCTGCHTIGRGVLTGPDLTTAITWREADLETAILRMQEKAGPISKDEITALIAFLKDSRLQERIATEEARIALQFAAKLEPPSAEAGERLFRGESPLTNGGMACVACHGVGGLVGGTLGPDLSGIFGRMGQTGLLSALEKAPFKVMSPVYAERPLTRQEVLHLTRWLQSVDTQPSAPRGDPIGPAAAGLAGLCLAVLVLGTRKTRRTNAREALTVRRRS